MKRTSIKPNLTQYTGMILHPDIYQVGIWHNGVPRNSPQAISMTFPKLYYNLGTSLLKIARYNP